MSRAALLETLRAHVETIRDWHQHARNLQSIAIGLYFDRDLWRPLPHTEHFKGTLLVCWGPFFAELDR